MKVIKPNWVGHGEMPIYSVDISPDDLRFATCGRGDASGKIVIWNMGPLLDEELDADENIPKILYQLDVHVGCVNCIRWNPDGKLLASCSDDKTVMVYRNNSVSNVTFKGYLKNVEVWRIVGTLAGHKSDVMDLGWAPKQPWLASCSVDNTVIVWDVDTMASVVQLKGHSGLVKGVEWDPLGQYLSSQSNDKTLRVWRTRDWKEEIVFSKPFLQSSDMTLVTRGDWSPDGQYLVGANAWNSGGPVACIIPVTRPFPSKETDLKDVIMDFVGHRKPVTCVKFHSGLWEKKRGDELTYCVLGTGSRDCSVAIWRTDIMRPVCVFKNFFTTSVSDLCWTRKGQCLIACSPSGGVAAFHFEEGELGVQCSDEKKTQKLLSVYGETMVKGNSGLGCIIETPDILLTTEATEKTSENETLTNGNIKENPPSKDEKMDFEVVSNEKKIVNGGIRETPLEAKCSDDAISELKQVERRTLDGKRRITPITLPKDAPLPPAKIQVVIEKHKEEEVPTPAKRRMENFSQPKTLHLGKSASHLPHSTLKCDDHSQVRSPGLPLTREIELKPLKVRPGLVVPIGDEGDSLELIEASPISILKRQSRGKQLTKWQFPCSGRVSAFVCNNTYTVVACGGPNTLQFLNSKTGWPMHLPILLSGVPSYLVLTNDCKTLIVTINGHLYVFNHLKLLMNVPTLRGCLLTESGQMTPISNCRLTENEVAIVSLANGKTIAWSKENSHWMLISDRSNIVWNAGREGTSEYNSIKRSRRFGIKTDLKCTPAYLQQEITAAKALGFVIKYRVSLMALIRHYAQEGEMIQLKHLLQSVSSSDSKEIFEECLNVIRPYEICQRLYVELKQSVEFNDIINDP